MKKFVLIAMCASLIMAQEKPFIPPAPEEPGEPIVMMPEMDVPVDLMLEKAKIAEELNLTKEQKKRLRELHFQTAKEAEKLKSNIRIANLELREMLLSDKLDRSKIESKVKEIGQLEIGLRLNRLKKFFSAKEILTDEQFEKLKEIIPHYILRKIREIKRHKELSPPR